MCGSCHTLVTHAMRPDGTPTGAAIDEQTPFLEYRASAFPAEGVTCQTCHMPRTDEDGLPIETEIAHRPDGGSFGPVAPRTPYGRHVMVGANTLIPQLLRDEATLGAVASPAAFDATIAAARSMLQQAARITVAAPTTVDDRRVVSVLVSSTTGHKFPSGYPSRRLVLHVRVLDAAGVVLLESGRLNTSGQVVSQAGSPLPFEAAQGPLSPHIDVVDSDQQALVYEQVPGDSTGADNVVVGIGADAQGQPSVAARVSRCIG